MRHVLVMPLAGTFDYVVVVPDRPGDEGFEGQATLRQAILPLGSRLSADRLVGHAPRVRIAVAGLTPVWEPGRGRVRRPDVAATASAMLVDGPNAVAIEK